MATQQEIVVRHFLAPTTARMETRLREELERARDLAGAMLRRFDEMHTLPTGLNALSNAVVELHRLVGALETLGRLNDLYR